MTLTIVDYGMGNLGAIPNMLARAGVEAVISGDPRVVDRADRVILPGVGSYDAAVRNLRSGGLWEALEHKALVDRVPILGLCLGMELLSDVSEEGAERGLGWIPGRVVRFASTGEARLPIPHMGWSVITAPRHSDYADVLDGARFYFAHSYFFLPDRPDDVIGVATYGLPFAAVVQRDNITGVQFHPEKSHRFGLALLRRFATT